MLKKDLDEVIRLSKKYYRTGDTDLLDTYFNARERCFGKCTCFEADLVDCITKKRRDYNEPYETYYKAFELFGYKIEDGE